MITVDELATYITEEVKISTDQNQNPQMGDISKHGSLGGFFFLNRRRQVDGGLMPKWNPKTAEAMGIEQKEDSSSLPNDITVKNEKIIKDEVEDGMKDGMVVIPAGEFQMGSDNGEDEEKPVHSIYIDVFYMDIYEVTNAQYKKFIDATGHKEPSYWNDSKYNSPNQPVVGVSWNDAKSYADWVGKRLPTEAEWEKAARGGLIGKKYIWGDEWPPPKGAGNFDDEGIVDSSFIEGYTDGYICTAPVGRFNPNGYGLCDMVGNVWEWCADWYSSSYYTNSSKKNPAGPVSGSYHVMRGGSWNDCIPDFLRVAYRPDPSYLYFYVGFRCVKNYP